MTEIQRQKLWAAVYHARLIEGNSVKKIDYMAHYLAVECADLALKAFDQRFNELKATP